MDRLISIRKDRYDAINYSVDRASENGKVLIDPAAVIALYKAVMDTLNGEQLLFVEEDELYTSDGRIIESDHRIIEVIIAISSREPITLCDLRLEVWGSPNIKDSTVRSAVSQARTVLMEYGLDIDYGKRGYSITVLRKIS